MVLNVRRARAQIYLMTAAKLKVKQQYTPKTINTRIYSEKIVIGSSCILATVLHCLKTPVHKEEMCLCIAESSLLLVVAHGIAIGMTASIGHHYVASVSSVWCQWI